MYHDPAIAIAAAAEPSDTLALCLTGGFGIGVRVLVDAPAGAVLDRFSGIIGPEISQHSLQIGPGLHISGTRFIGYLSHGCDPNCRLDMDRFRLVTRRPVMAGDLLTIDYAETEDALHVQFACHCGADHCREWITGREEPANSAGASYLAALSPRARCA